MDKAAAAAFVAAAIASGAVVVFSKSFCPYCHKAKAALKSVMGSIAYVCIELESLPDCDAIQDALLALTGGRSVPRVFVGGQFIGGGDDTASKASNGELKKLIEAAGVAL